METVAVTLRDIYLARQKIASIAVRTPLVHSPGLSQRLGAEVYLKLETVQQTGSFKVRGAANKLLSLPPELRQRGVITVSSGNHGRALAHVARQLGARAVVCVAEAVPQVKREAIRALGAELVVYGQTFEESLARAAGLQEEQGLVMIHPFDDPLIIAGQGTLGLELLQDLPELDAVVVPLSGGGLLGGIALALKSACSNIRTVGVSMERGPAMVESLRAGRVVDVLEEPTLADALAGGIAPNVHTFGLVQKYVDDTALVSEDEIAAAMAWALREQGMVVEGGGAVGLAALLSGKVQNLGRRVVVVLSGSNVDMALLLELAQDK